MTAPVIVAGLKKRLKKGLKKHLKKARAGATGKTVASVKPVGRVGGPARRSRKAPSLGSKGKIGAGGKRPTMGKVGARRKKPAGPKRSPRKRSPLRGGMKRK